MSAYQDLKRVDYDFGQGAEVCLRASSFVLELKIGSSCLKVAVWFLGVVSK